MQDKELGCLVTLCTCLIGLIVHIKEKTYIKKMKLEDGTISFEMSFKSYITYCRPLFRSTTTPSHSPSCGRAFPTIYQSYLTAEVREPPRASVHLQPPFKSLSPLTRSSSPAPPPLTFVVVCHAYRISLPAHRRRSGMMSGPIVCVTSQKS